MLKIIRNTLKSRRGSVMVMVITLLALLALMGTAWLATVRTDRSAASSHMTNVQADLFLQGLQALIGDSLIDDERGYDTNKASPSSNDYQYRPRWNTAEDFSYTHWDCPLPDPTDTKQVRWRNDQWLASRTPGSAAYWPAISSPLVANLAQGDADATLFESQNWFVSPLATGGDIRYRQRTNLAIRSVNLLVNGVPTPWPAFRLSDGRTVLAADADGDGVADSGLWHVPTSLLTQNGVYGQKDGVTWMYAVRIIDNNSALNVNTAYEAVPTGGTGIRATNFLPSNINLKGLLAGNPQSQINTLNSYRNGGGFGDPTDEDGNLLSFSGWTDHEALWMQLGRRVEYPGYSGRGTARYRAIGMADQFALSYRFLIHPSSGSLLETPVGGLGPSLWRSGEPQSPYPADAYQQWHNSNFGSTDFSRRALLVTHNPVTNAIASARTDNATPPTATPHFGSATTYQSIPLKASLNTATFEELWRAYWNVMVDRPAPPGGAGYDPNFDTTPFHKDLAANNPTDPFFAMDPANPVSHPARMFRSSVRDGSASRGFKPQQQLLLRAAIAAANTIQLRSGKRDTCITQTISIPSRGGDAQVTIYPTLPQPYISEVYIQTDTAWHDVDWDGVSDRLQNPKGYVAIALFNPHTEAIDLTGWKVAIVDRPADGSGSRAPTMLAALDFYTGKNQIPPGSFAIIENYKEGGGTAQYPPKSVNHNALSSLPLIYVSDLDRVVNKELVIMRPAGGGLAPVDQFDVTQGAIEPPEQKLDHKTQPTNPADPATPVDPDYSAQWWHYVRNTRDPWKCVYPGRYWFHNNGATKDVKPRQDGTTMGSWKPIWSKDEPFRFRDPANHPTLSLGRASAGGAQAQFTIQLANKDWAGPNADQPQFPYGGFARVGDILQVPFIGAYRVEVGGTVIELNAVTMDSVFAEDSFVNDDLVEQIGRFCPVPQDFAAGPADFAQWRYRWAMNIFDYFTVLAPHEDYLPNAPREWANKTPAANGDYTKYPNAINDVNNLPERSIGVHGLININTASARVLAAVPFLDDPAQNLVLAQAIVNFRDGNGAAPGHGPFKNLFELYLVPEFQQFYNAAVSNGIPDPDDKDGDISPLNGTSGTPLDGVRGDFEEQFLVLNRVSNMITTRSDSFTAYLLLQGWRNVGSATPELVAQRRIGVILDRTGVTPDPNNPARLRRNLKTWTFPLD